MKIIFFVKKVEEHRAYKPTMLFVLLVLFLNTVTLLSYGQLSTANLTISRASVAADSAVASFSELKEGDTTVLQVKGGSLGAGATWVWRAGSATGAVIGHGDSIVVAPTETTEYFCTVEGGCNIVACRSLIVTIDNTPLPLKLISFTAQLHQQYRALLGWETAFEVNTSHFIIEESFDGVTYHYLDTVLAENKEGNHLYQYVDNHLKSGLNYYRLKMVNKDGTVNYSPVRFVNYSTDNSIPPSVKLYPNPTNDNVVLDLESSINGGITVWITNVLAQKITGVIKAEVKIGKNIIPIKTDALADGTYMLYYQIEDQSREGIKFVKTSR